ncbi:Adenylyl cyclase-associated protein [Lachnellula arida]|uniref:Adenylyl cyclase-associated protein n=1 Tax=Lachnellula arida TaxID=1316785 RepID=A0A8T9B944_9HELO|nr:Adenylyl cyclase-associated protein [Lachnellula arida]
MDDKVLPTVSRTELTAIIHRLEAATSRLEDMATSSIEIPKLNGVAPTPAPTGPLPPPPTISQTPPQPPKPVQAPLPEVVEDFNTFLAGSVKKFVNLSDDIGGAIAEQASGVLRAFTAQRKFILITTKAKKPDQSSSQFLQLWKPIQEAATAVGDLRDANRGKPTYNQLSAVGESITVLAWVIVDPKPVKHVEEYLDQAKFWGNRVLKEYKDKDPKQVEWIQAYYQIFKDLIEYIQHAFPQGIPWNPKGASVEEAVKSVQQSQPSPPAPQAAGGAPPPPPPPPGPPPPPMRFDEPKAAPVTDGGLGAVFSELNKGEAVTKGLRKVNADQMTHKNPSLRAGATVPTRSDSQSSVSSISRGKSPAPGKKPKPESMRTKKPPVKKLDGNKWIIENFENETEPIEIEASISHSILITKFDVIKSANFALQVMGTLPTILMDSVDGAQVYLGKDSMSTEVFTSKCSGINLNIFGGEEEDYKEVPLPEQIRTVIGAGGKVISEIVEHAG